MRTYILIALVLLWVTGYLFRADRKIKNTREIVIDTKDRPSVNKDAFFFWLEEGSIDNADFSPLVQVVSKYIYGDVRSIYAILIALLGKWHIILQWLPWTGKTTLVRVLAHVSWLSHARIQCTPDLLPQDIIGTEVFNPSDKTFHIHYWPIVTNLLHVDEINRATPKLQSAFLEAMQEKSISIGKETKHLPDPFFVIATQNPYDAIGTYMLPYGQIDRFMVGVYTSGLEQEEEYKMLQDSKQLSLDTKIDQEQQVFSIETVLSAQKKVDTIQIDESVLHHAVQCIYIVKKYAESLSTRASKSLLIAAKSWAYLQWKNTVSTTDVDAVLSLVLQHRVSYILWKDVSPKELYEYITGA